MRLRVDPPEIVPEGDRCDIRIECQAVEVQRRRQEFPATGEIEIFADNQSVHRRNTNSGQVTFVLERPLRDESYSVKIHSTFRPPNGQLVEPAYKRIEIPARPKLPVPKLEVVCDRNQIGPDKFRLEISARLALKGTPLPDTAVKILRGTEMATFGFTDSDGRFIQLVEIEAKSEYPEKIRFQVKAEINGQEVSQYLLVEIPAREKQEAKKPRKIKVDQIQQGTDSGQPVYTYFLTVQSNPDDPSSLIDAQIQVRSDFNITAKEQGEANFSRKDAFQTENGVSSISVRIENDSPNRGDIWFVVKGGAAVSEKQYVRTDKPQKFEWPKKPEKKESKK